MVVKSIAAFQGRNSAEYVAADTKRSVYMEKTTLRKLLKKGQLQAPSIFDCISARAVELVGYKAAYLSSEGISYSWGGVPDMGLISPDEMMWLAQRVVDYIPMPVIVGLENGYSNNPLVTFRAVERLVKMGVDSFIIDDTSDFRGIDSERIETVDKKVWLGKIKAALTACAGTDCMVIARTFVKATEGLSSAIERCKAAEELGADLTCIEGLRSIDEAKEFAAVVKGAKMWSDLGAENGKSDVEPSDIEKLNFPLITIHFTEKGAMFGMLDFAKENNKNGNTVYHDMHNYDGMLEGTDYHELFSFHKKWIPMEDRFLDVKHISEKPNVVQKQGGQ